MKISKKIDTIIDVKETPLLISPVFKSEESDTIYCNYGEIDDDLYRAIKRKTNNQPPGAIDTLTTRNCLAWPDLISCEKAQPLIKENENIFKLEKGKYLVVTISFLFDLYDKYRDYPTIKEFVGVVETKINSREKKQIRPSVFTSEDVARSSRPASFDLIRQGVYKNSKEMCNPVLYEVDLLIYGNNIQYFKGHIGYIISTFSQPSELGNEIDLRFFVDPENECVSPIKIYEEQTLFTFPDSYPIIYHVNFFGIKKPYFE